MRYKLVLVGEAPGRDPIVDRPSLALTGSSGRNLCTIAGWDWLEYLRKTERFNLFYEPQFAWSRWKAEGEAELLVPKFVNRQVILLGSKVAEAFKVRGPNYEWMEPFPINAAVALVPHPSGRNRLWNSTEERATARAFLGDLLDG